MACYNVQLHCIFHKVVLQYCYSVELHCTLLAVCFCSQLQCGVTLYCTCSVFLQPVTALCSSEPSARPGGPVAGSLDSHRASLAAAARLSPVSLSVDAARRPSAFIAHLAHKHPDVYMTDLGASTPSDKSCRPGATTMSASGECHWCCFRSGIVKSFFFFQTNFMETKKAQGPKSY